MAGRPEHTRQINIKVTPELYGKLAVLGVLRDTNISEEARRLLEGGIQRQVDEVPEIQAAFDAAEQARASLGTA